MNPYLNEAEKALIAELRSGNRRQVKHALRDDDEKGSRYCCLGVACDISNLGHWEEHRGPTLDSPQTLHYEINSDTNGGYLPLAVQNQLGWSHSDGRLIFRTAEHDSTTSLAELNDAGFTFDQIADVIEAGLVRRLGDPPTDPYVGRF